MRTRNHTLLFLSLAGCLPVLSVACAAGEGDLSRDDGAADDGTGDFGPDGADDGFPNGTSDGDASGSAGTGDGDGDGDGDGTGDGDGDGEVSDDPVGAERVDGAFGLGASPGGTDGMRARTNAVGVASPASTGLLAGADHDARVYLVDGELPTLRLDISDAFGEPLEATAVDIVMEFYDGPVLNGASLLGTYSETVDVESGRTRVGQAVDWWHLLDVADSMWVQFTIDGDTLGDALELRSSLVAATAEQFRASGVVPAAGHRLPIAALDGQPVVVDTRWMSIGDSLPTVPGMACEWILSAPSFPRAEEGGDVLMAECASSSGHGPIPPPSIDMRMGRSVLLEPYATLCTNCTPRINATRSEFEVTTSCLGQPAGSEPSRRLELVDRRNVSAPHHLEGDAPILVTSICQNPM